LFGTNSLVNGNILRCFKTKNLARIKPGTIANNKGFASRNPNSATSANHATIHTTQQSIPQPNRTYAMFIFTAECKTVMRANQTALFMVGKQIWINLQNDAIV